jgi:hypothetical protein
VRPPRGALVVGLAAIIATLAGCRDTAVPRTTPPPVDLTWTLRPQPPVVGPATLAVSLAAGGTPIDDATVQIVGLMTHPGMAPLPVTTMPRGGGLYDGVFSFTMPGDWALVVTVQLADGRRLEKRVDVPGVRAAG